MARAKLASSLHEQIRIYRFRPTRRNAAGAIEPGELERLGNLTLRLEDGAAFPARHVQSAIVTPNHHLLMVCDTPVGEAVSGLHLFDLMTGIRRWHTRWVDVTSYHWPTKEKYHEAEDVVVADAEGFYVHVLFCSKNLGTRDGAKVLRYDTARPEERVLL